MRDIEFRELKPGDIVYNPGQENELWTVASYFPRHDTFLLLYGRHILTKWGKFFWRFIVRLSDETCLGVADYMDLRIARIFDTQKWEKECL